VRVRALSARGGLVQRKARKRVCKHAPIPILAAATGVGELINRTRIYAMYVCSIERAMRTRGGGAHGS